MFDSGLFFLLFAQSFKKLPPFVCVSTWRRLGNAFKDPVSGVRMTSNTVFLWPGSKTNVPSVLTKSFPEIAGDMTVRPIVSVLLNS